MKSMFKVSPWHFPGLLLIGLIVLVGCANPSMQTSDQTALSKSSPESLVFYSVPFT